MTPKISIVIPTYLRHDKLRDCLRSINEYVDPEMCSVEVVANGAAEEARQVYADFQAVWQGKSQLLWYNEPLGYSKACNLGIKATDSEFVLLFNDDCEFLPQPKNECVDVLLKPFLEDQKVGITGPQRIFDENSGQEFLIFFCVLIRRKMFESTGYLDETFGMGFGEDTALCIQARCKGWKTLQVPRDDVENTLAEIDPNHPTLEAWKHDKIWAGDFRLWHDAESTIGRLPNSEEVLRKNRKILRERYGPQGCLRDTTMKTPTGMCEQCGGQLMDRTCLECVQRNEGLTLWRAHLIDGWFGLDEGAQLARWVKALPECAKILEVGSWHGRSSRFIADNLPEYGQVWCVDTWIGSSGEPEMHGSAHYDRGDHAHQWWWCNMQEHIESGTCVPVRMHSENAAHTIKHLIEKGQMEKFDLIFIDGDHSAEGIKTDDEAWSPLLKEGGLLCGHDYYKEHEGPHWVHVRQYVESKYPNVQKIAASLWYVRPEPRKPAVFDCFPFNDELDLLELRFNELDSVVDRWVITESPITHSGQPKPLYFKENMGRFEKWLNKITHIVVDDFQLGGLEGPDKHWAIERHQRSAIMRGLESCSDDDIILIGDTDEIPNAEAIKKYQTSMGMACLEMKLYYGYMNLQGLEPWRWTRLLPYGLLKTMGPQAPCAARYNWGSEQPNYGNIIPDGGWHFSFMGGPDEWVRKLEATPHQEYNKPEFKDKQVLQQRALNGEDLLGRPERYEWVPIDESFPQYVRENVRKFVDNKFIYESKLMSKTHVNSLIQCGCPACVDSAAARGIVIPPNYATTCDCPIGDEGFHCWHCPRPDVTNRAWWLDLPEGTSGISGCASIEKERSMHPESWQFIAKVKAEHPEYFEGKSVLEVGSLNINGSVRQFFHGGFYYGIDLGSGPDVDEVIHVVDLPEKLEFDVVICSEALEHDARWRESLRKMYRLLRPNGMLLITCAGPTRPEHGTKRTDTYSSPFTVDYYRNISQEDFLEVLKPDEFNELTIGYERGMEDLNAYGFKKEETPASLPVLPEPISKYAKPSSVTACVSTKDRYQTTLPLCLSAIINQTDKPNFLVIYDDSEHRMPAEQFEKTAPFDGLLRMARENGIDWRVFSTPRAGQVANHQHCLDNAETEWIWRVDDDEIPAPDCLERLLNTVRDYGLGDESEKIGAAGGLVHHPGNVVPLPPFLDGSLNDVKAGMNLAWYDWNGGPRQVEHLYSTFLLKVGAARGVGGYPRGLSPVGHREETIITHLLHRAGWKVILTPHAKTWHLRESSGGIRSYQDNSLWEHDEQVFQSYLQEWGANGGQPRKLIVADSGIGDHFCLKSILPELRKRHAGKEIILALCFPEVFSDEPDVKIISIAEAKQMLGARFDESNFYRWCIDRRWSDPIREGMLEFYGS